MAGCIALPAILTAGPSLWWARLLILLMGVSLVVVPTQAATFATVSAADTGRASTLFNVTRQLGGTIGVALPRATRSRGAETGRTPSEESRAHAADVRLARCRDPCLVSVPDRTAHPIRARIAARSHDWDERRQRRLRDVHGLRLPADHVVGGALPTDRPVEADRTDDRPGSGTELLRATIPARRRTPLPHAALYS